VTLVLGGLLRQDVTLEGLTALDGATGTNAETLFRAAFGLHFGHVNAPLVCAREAPQIFHGLVGPETLLHPAPAGTGVPAAAKSLQ
jgi:hypothetical protein